MSPVCKRILSLIALSLLVPMALMAQTLSLSPSSENFGSTPVGTGTAWFTFTLTNGNSSAVSISNVTASGPFVVSSNCTSSVAANSSCPIYVYFAPTASGAASGTLAVTDSASNSPQSAALSGTGGSGGGTCATSPNAPAGLAASGTTSSGTSLSWNAVTPPTSCTISNYAILENGSSIGTASGTSFTVTGLTASTTYSFTVEAMDSNGSSAPSSAVSVTTSAGGGGGTCDSPWSSTQVYTAGMTASYSGENYVANYWTEGNNPSTNNGGAGSGQPWTATGACSSCSSAPAVPTGLAASGTTQSTTNLTWSAVNPPAGCSVSYKVLQSSTVIATPTTTSDAVTGLTPSTTYSFSVEATDSAGTSAASSAVNVTTTASTCTTKPSAPTGFADSGVTDSSVNLSWNTVSPPTGCTISYSISGGPSTLTTSSTSDTEGGLTPSTSYTFSLTATDYAGSSSATTVTVETSAPSTLFMGGWYEEWGTYYANYNVAQLQANGVAGVLTHLIYAFAKPIANGSDVNCALADTYADYQKVVPQVTGATPATAPLQGNFGALVQLKQLNPNLKVLISIGGWNPPTYNTLFDQAASTEAQRQAFVGSCINMFLQGNIASGVSTGTLFDGIDLDWEFPNANDTANFTALLTEFRNEMNTLTGTTGKTYQLLADLAAGPSTPGAAADSGNDGGYNTIDISAVAAELNYMNIDGYNYDGDWTNATNDASALYDEPANPLYGTPADDIDATVQYYLAQGAPAAKYTMGFPLYGAGWAGGLTSANGGMYQNATGVTDGSGATTTNGTSPVYNANGVGYCSSGDNQSSPAAGCDVLLTDGLATYGTIVNLLNNGFTPSYDSTRCAARMFNSTTSTAFSYDNATSVQCKVNFIKAQGFGGGYVWALKDDDSNSDLTKAIANDLNP
jgi:chitinase